MIEIFKTWLNMIIITGIIFTIIRIITPNTSMKKYVYSLIGIVTVIVILSPVISIISNGDIGRELSESLQDIMTVETMSSNYIDYEEVGKNNIKENFKSKIETDIKNKLNDKINQPFEVNVQISDAYNIDKVYITLTASTGYDISSYISQEYDILKENIIINKGG